jgi:hypothetical protein
MNVLLSIMYAMYQCGGGKEYYIGMAEGPIVVRAQ